jgi:glycerol-3-phosphate O-acyltransferase/dihydroxyacetone phosphate acyltransferase
MLTEKVLFCILMVPTLWITYGVLLTFFTDLEGPTIALVMGIMPVFAYTGIIVADAGMVDWQDLRPYIMRVFPSTRRQLAALPQKRKQLRDDLRLFIKSMGPSLGDIYYGKNLDWQKIHRVSSVDDSRQLLKESKKAK